MPLRRHRTLLLLSLLSSAAAAEPSINWVDEDTMSALEPALQKALPPHCGGLYYNPAFTLPAETRDTVITAANTSLTPNGLAKLSGDVQIFQPKRRLFAEEAELNQATGDFRLAGDIRVEMPNLTFTAHELVGNTRNETAQLSGARYALFDLHARGTAEGFQHNKLITEIEHGSYTTCPPDSDAWLISANDIELDQESGWGEARNVVLRVQNVPIIWLPWMTFPIDDRRKTGLLFPSIGGGDEGGVDISQPIYLNLHPQYDAIIAPRHIQSRGNGFKTDFRYLGELGTGNISYGWLSKDKLFDDEDRAQAQWRHDGNINRWFFNTDINYVSDDFYLKDLDSGLEVSSTTHLARFAEARYLGRTWQLLARAQSWQTIDPLLADADLPYRRLPQFQVSGDPTLMGPVKMEWLSDYTYFDRKANLLTDDTLGHRVHAQPALTMRLENEWGYFQPRARLYYTDYDLEESSPGIGADPERHLWGYNLDAGMVFERYAAENTFLQTLEPRIFFNRVEYQQQDNLPLFDSDELTPSYAALFRENRFTGYDRIGDEQSTTLAVSSRFLDPQSGEESLRLRIAQKIYHDERRVQVEGLIETDKTSPLISEASMKLTDDWNVEVFNHWNSSLNRRELNGLRVSFRDNQRRLLSLNVTDRPRDDLLQGELAALVPVHSRWNLVGRWFYDINEQRSLETLSGVEYSDCCWGVRFVNLRELSDEDGDGTLEGESTWMVQIVLNGLGGFGGRIDSLLERSIPGYRSKND